jgi:hypothetical protein
VLPLTELDLFYQGLRFWSWQINAFMQKPVASGTRSMDYEVLEENQIR